jgi:queuosine precursor transporter
MNKYIYALIYIVVIAIANLTANNFLYQSPIITITLGTVIFSAVFTLRDKLHQFGKPIVYIAIILATIVSYFINVYTNTPSQIVLASVIALFLGELTDTEVFDRVKQKSWLVRSLYSNLASVPTDTILFNCIAFWGDPVMQALIPTLIVGDLVVKLVFSTGLSLVYTQIDKLKTGKAV